MARYDLSTTTVDELLQDPDVVAIVERIRPGLLGTDDVRAVAAMTVEEALERARPYAREGELEAARAELDAL